MDEEKETFDCPECSPRRKKRTEEEIRDLQNRLNRIEGQVRGVKRMVDEGYYCADIITQVSAIKAALNGFETTLLGNHIRSCVTEDITSGNTEKREELIALLTKLIK